MEDEPIPQAASDEGDRGDRPDRPGDEDQPRRRSRRRRRRGRGGNREGVEGVAPGAEGDFDSERSFVNHDDDFIEAEDREPAPEARRAPPPGPRRDRADRAPAPEARRTPEPDVRRSRDDDDDFGELPDEDLPFVEDDATAPPARAAEGDEGDRPRRSRRRRRRRGGERRPTEGALEGAERAEARPLDDDDLGDEPPRERERPERGERTERPARGERTPRPERSDRAERGPRSERGERPSRDRGERSDRDRARPPRPRQEIPVDDDFGRMEDEVDHLPGEASDELDEHDHGQKRIPTWQETVGMLVEANIASRASHPEPRHRGGRRPRRDGR